MTKVVIVYGEDREALYLDGKLDHAGHTLSAAYCLHRLNGQTIGEIDTFLADVNWYRTIDEFPEMLFDVECYG